MPVVDLGDGRVVDFGNMPESDVTSALKKLAPQSSPEGGSTLSALWQGFKHGAVNPLYGMAQVGARVATEGNPDFPAVMPREQAIEAIDRLTHEREAAYQADPTVKAHPTAARIGQFGGEVAASAPLMLVPGGQATMPARLGAAALTGAGAATTTPVTTDTNDFWSKKLKQLGAGAAGGAVGGAAGEALGSAVSPAMNKAAQALASQGVTLTPGQAIGGVVRRAEEAAKSFPILGSFIRGAEGRSLDSFNRSVINQALEPISEKLPKDMKAGREAIDHAATVIGDAYDRLLPRMQFFADQQFAAEMGNLRSMASEMPGAQAEQFHNIIENRLIQRLSGPGYMDGQTLKQVESELGHLASTYRSSSDAAQRQLASALDETRSLMRQALIRQNPDQATELQNINAAYAMLTRVEGAAARRVGGQGVFTPVDLLSAVRSGDRTVRKRDFARGDALMQTFAETAQSVLPSKLPDSGTAERGAWLGIAEALGEGYGLLHYPKYAIPAMLAATLPYTQAGQRAVGGYLAPGTTRQAIGAVPRAVEPALGVMGGVEATLPQDQYVPGGTR